MKESILHYIWQQKIFSNVGLKTTDGELVEIIDTGKLNTDAGPDFFNAKIKIGNTLWAGNVEIHIAGSDWYKHSHQNDKLYDNVILHVVKLADADVFRSDGEKIPTMILQYPESVEQNYEELLKNQLWIPCALKINAVPDIFINAWKTALLTERLESKTGNIRTLLQENTQHWEEAFYVTLARSFGFGTNSQAFELLARSTPLGVLAKHKNDLQQLEALLLGQAGLLEKDKTDEYILKLKQEYLFLKNKFNLQGIGAEQWKFLRLRPDNFPYIRIAQLANLIHKSSKLFSKMIENPDIDLFKELLQTEPSEYWNTHYLPGQPTKEKHKKLGESSINSLIINTVVPFLFCYADLKGKQDLKDKAIQLLNEIPAEKNAIISGWTNLGIQSESAFDTQALLQLKKNYCDEKKCLRCRIGHKVLTKN